MTTATHAAGNGEAELAVPAALSAARAGRNCRVDVCSRGEFRATRRAWRSEAPAKPALRQACFYPPSCRHKKGGRPPWGETRPTGADRRQPENQTARISSLDPGLAGRRIVPGMPRLETRRSLLTPPAMAKLSRQQPLGGAERSLAAGGNCRTMSEFARASFDATRRAGGAREPGGAGAAAGRFCPSSCRHKKGWSPAGRDSGQPPPTDGIPEKPNSKDQESRTRPAPGRRIVTDAALETTVNARRRQWRNMPAAAFPFW